MRVTLNGLCQKRVRSRRDLSRHRAEAVESRCFLNAVWPTVSEPVANDTLDLAEDLGELINDLQTTRVGSIGDSPAVALDVDWYQFNLTRASHVELTSMAASPDSGSQTCLSLYNSSPFTGEDLYNPLGHRLLAQAESDSYRGLTHIDSQLAAGTYYVAVSGAGNETFHPFVANSGYPGATGNYVLQLTSTPLDIGQTDGPTVLTTDPAPDSSLTSSPFVIRVDLSAELDPGTIVPDETVQVTYSPNESFDDGDEVSVPLTMFSFSSTAAELQLTPSMPLAVGYYQVTLAGDLDQQAAVLTDLNGVPLGSCDACPQGHDYSFQFQVTGVEGASSEDANSDDTPESAHQLGNLTSGDLVQVSGAIGDAPFYDPSVDSLLNPANDVDLYHFQVTGEGTYAFVAEVFAGRIGSPLDPGVSLFRVDPNDGSLQFVAGDNNTHNATVATNGTLPLFTDATLFAGLTAGDYYIAVSSGFNTPAPTEGQPVGGEGIFDPAQSHSGWIGTSTGRYLLNVQLTADSIAPVVVSTSLNSGETLSQPPTHLVVGFSETVNLQQLAFEEFPQTRGDIAAVFIQAADGTKYLPRFNSYDSTTNQATFLMLDALPNGAFEWHLSSGSGLSDLAGNPLTGNSANGDYVVTFDVSAAPRGTEGHPTQWTAAEPNDALESPQNLGVLFPQEFASGIKVTRPAIPGTADTADYYRFEILRNQKYQFNVSGVHLPPHIALGVFDIEGEAIRTSSSRTGAKTATLHPGVYYIRVDGWEASDAAALQYQLSLTAFLATGNPPPLTTGPAPSLQLRLIGTTSLPSDPPQVVFQNNNPDVVNAGGNGNVGSQTDGTGVVDAQSPGPSPSSSNVGGTTQLPSSPSQVASGTNGQNSGPSVGNGNSIGQTNAVVSVIPQIPSTSLVTFGERLVGGIGVAANVVASNNGSRVVLQLPEWFEWAGSQDFAFINISSSVRERLLRKDADEEFDGTVPTPTDNASKAPPAESNSAQVRGDENSDNEKSSLPSDPSSRESANRKDASEDNTKSPNEGTKSTAKDASKGDSVSAADFEWLPALAAVMTGAFGNISEENSKGRRFFARHRALDGITSSNTAANSSGTKPRN